MTTHARHLRAIVFSDVVDSSVKIFADELIAIQRIKEDLALIREALQSHGGALVKSLGDGLLVTFDGPTHALEFIQSALQSLHSQGRQPLAHRFGLHTGEIYADGDDILGQGVHLASRLQTVSPANGVAFTRSTYELIDPRFRSLARSMGSVELKGLPERMELYCLGADELLRFGRQEQDDRDDLSLLLEDTPYTVVRSLSRSRQPQTLLLKEKQRDRQAVLKLIPTDASLEEALRVEAASLDRLRHPRIPRVLDAYARDGRFCFIQEYIPGPSLHGSLDLLRKKQRLAELLRQVLQMLETLHSAGLMHGDIHPANLIPSDSGCPPFLVDFSLLRARTEARLRQADRRLEASVSELGRPYFSAPERARFGRLTPSADLYALGVTALLLFTGGSPKDLYDEIQACWRLEGLDSEVVRWLAPLLEDQPARRLQSAADALQLLDQPTAVTAAVPAAAELRRSDLPVLNAVSKAELQRHLVVTYGPMVDLLLETAPTTVEPSQLSALRERLIASGMAAADVDAALRQAVVQPPVPADQASPAHSSTTRTVVAESPSGCDGGKEAHPLLAALRQRIGPIADFIWTDELPRLAELDPAAFRAHLDKASVPAVVVDALLNSAALDSAASATDHRPDDSCSAEPLSASEPLTQGDPCSMPTTDPAQLSSDLAELIGPVATMVMQEVAVLPASKQPQAIVDVMVRLGVASDLVNTFRTRQGMAASKEA